MFITVFAGRKCQVAIFIALGSHTGAFIFFKIGYFFSPNVKLLITDKYPKPIEVTVAGVCVIYNTGKIKKVYEAINLVSIHV